MNLPLPKVLYKYTRRSYALQMLVEGKVFINTPENFRKDKYGLEIRDIGEGTQITHMRGKPIDLTRSETIPPTIKRMQETKRLIGTGKLIVQKTVNESVQNLYVYCLSTEKDLIEKFGKDTAEYDSVIEISNPLGFIEALTRGINWKDSSIITCNYSPIEYISREQEFEKQTPTHPVFVKDPRHSWQKELRLVWDVGGKEINSITLRCPQIKDFIKII